MRVPRANGLPALPSFTPPPTPPRNPGQNPGPTPGPKPLPKPAPNPPPYLAPATTVGPYAATTLESGAALPAGGATKQVHASRDVIIERYRTDGRVQIQGGGQTGAALRQAQRSQTSAATASPVYSVPQSLLPVEFNLNNRTPGNVTSTQGGTVQGAITGAIQEINTAAGQTLISPTLGTTSTRTAANDGNNIISFVQGNYKFNRNTLAVSISYLSGSSIVGSDVLFNPRQAFSTDDSGSLEQQTFDVQGVATHELLHTVGVPHITSDPDATMYPSVSPTDDVKLRTLEPADVGEVLFRYPMA